MTQQEHKTVFISYRRKPAAFIARAIFMDLQAHGYDVFMDVENINSGDFGAIIDSQIEARAHFLIILTTGTVGRFDEPKDWLRHEIEYAMAQQRNIVPLLINNFKYDKRAKKYLTGDLAELPRLNGLRIHHEYFDEAMERLRKRFLTKPFYGELKPAPASDQPAVTRKMEEAAAQLKPTKEELSAEDYFNKAMALNDNSEQEIAYYTEAIRLNPQYAKAYYNRGVVRTDKGDLDGAIADYGEAIRLDPQDAGAYNNRGNARSDKGDLNSAIADYDEAIRLNPQYIDAYYNRGVARNNKRDFSGAIADYQRYLDLGGGKRDGDQAGVEKIIRELKAKLK